MCDYCEINNYGAGDCFKFRNITDKINQDLEVCIVNNIGSPGFTLNIDGDQIEIDIDIKYCPICGGNYNERRFNRKTKI